MHSKYQNIYFTTLAIDNFFNIFKDFPETNFIILNPVNDLIENRIVKVFAFLIMRNHIHIVWQILEKHHIEDTITSFKKYIGRLIIKYLRQINEDYLNNFRPVRKDREYKIWKLTKGNIIIHSSDMLGSKIRDIHNNPITGECKSINDCSDYYFSSANAYAIQASNF